MKYFMITALPKSGTTWVQRLCRAHPRMHCRAEDQFTKAWPGLQNLLRDYNSLIDLRDQERDGQGVERYTEMDATKVFYAMIKVALDKAPPGTLWSGVKEISLSAKGFLTMLPRSHIINVIRDPRDIAISAWSHRRRIGEADAGDPHSPSLAFVSDTAEHWLKQLDLSRKAHALAPGRSHDIRYEDLITEFAGTTHALLEFLDVARDPATIEAMRDDTDFSRLSGGRAPGQEDDTSYFRKGLAGDWRNILSTEQIALVGEICGDALPSWGYPDK